MVALKIISTVFIGLSCITAFLKNILAFDKDKYIISFTIYGWLWRALVIVTLWLI